MLAFVLKTQDYRDTSLLGAFYTRDSGKIKAIVKGGRDARGRYGSTLEPFSLNEILLYERKRGDLHLVTGVELVDRFEPLRRDVDRVGCAAYFLELVDQMTDAGGPAAEIFGLLRQALSEMAAGLDPHRAARVFEVKLMKELGFMPELDGCVRCGNEAAESSPGPVASDRYFSVGSGGIVCRDCRSGEGPLIALSGKTEAFLKTARDAEFRAAVEAPLAPEAEEKARRLLRQFVDHHLAYKPKSLIFLEKLAAS